jgi:hypothetical protein
MAELKKYISGNNLQDPAVASFLRAIQTDLTALRRGVAGLLTGSATYNPASLADGAGATATVTVPGAQIFDFAFASFGLDLQGVTMTAYCSAVDTVSVRFQNESGGPVDLASATIQARVIPATTATKFLGMLEGSVTYDLASLVDGVGATTTVTVTGAALGDFVLVSHGVDLQGILMTAYVSAADTVSVRFQNETAGTLDLASSTIRVRVIPFATAAALNSLGSSSMYGSATYDAASLADGAGETTTVTVTGAQLGDFPVVSLGVDLQGITVSAYVSAADTVSVRLQNESTGPLDLASATLRALVMRSSATHVFTPPVLMA